MWRPFALSVRSPSLLVPFVLLIFSAPLYGSAPGAGSVEIVGSLTGSHAVTTSDREDGAKHSKGTLELDLGIGYFLTDLLEFIPRIEWTGGSSRRERHGDGFYDGASSIYGVSGLLVVNRATEKAGVLFLGIGGGVMANSTFDMEPVRFPVLEAGTRVLLGNSVSLNVTAYYERRRYDLGMDDSSANSYGLKAGFSLFPLALLGNREGGR